MRARILQQRRSQHGVRGSATLQIRKGGTADQDQATPAALALRGHSALSRQAARRADHALLTREN